MIEVDYKGYVIEGQLSEIPGQTKWEYKGEIWKYRGGISSQKPFYPPSDQAIFDTEKDAAKHCLERGKMIIDGKIKNCTVHDL